ncbi:MAG: hypothetical protein ABS36_13585 [Acidobacteria bacterium SCN 69-37]|nr:MAG: hypothetical protein ABS36_13585 [Acidobacteria bacterium SCN 69-37]
MTEKLDELIDTVAQRMTEADGHPDMRTRVMAVIDDRARLVRRPWLMPLMATGAAAGAALVWMLVSPRPLPLSQPVPPASQAQAPAAPATPVAALQPETVSSPAPVVRRMTAAPRATARLSSAMPESVIATHMSEPPWPDDEQNMTIPTLPALAGPAPITIEPIGWHDLAIAPVTVAAIEVKAIELEPLRTGAGGA